MGHLAEFEGRLEFAVLVQDGIDVGGLHGGGLQIRCGFIGHGSVGLLAEIDSYEVAHNFNKLSGIVGVVQASLTGRGSICMSLPGVETPGYFRASCGRAGFISEIGIGKGTPRFCHAHRIM